MLVSLAELRGVSLSAGALGASGVSEGTGGGRHRLREATESPALPLTSSTLWCSTAVLTGEHR